MFPVLRILTLCLFAAKWSIAIALVYLTLAEALSWAPVPDLALCLIQPEHGQQTADHDNKKYCPAFHTGAALVFDNVDTFLEHHDKSVVGGFTIVLAISTIGLWLATNKLWSAGERQIELLAKSSADQSRDMQASIAIAKRSAEIAEYSIVQLQRALLVLTKFNVDTSMIRPQHLRNGKQRAAGRYKRCASTDN